MSLSPQTSWTKINTDSQSSSDDDDNECVDSTSNTLASTSAVDQLASSSDAVEMVSLNDVLAQQSRGYRSLAKLEARRSQDFAKTDVNVQLMWRDVDVPSSQDRARREFKFMIRKGVPDRYRASVWLSVCGVCDPSIKKEFSSFDRCLTFTFGTTRNGSANGAGADDVDALFVDLPNVFPTLPLFGADAGVDRQWHVTEHLLRSSGKLWVQRLLLMLSKSNPELDYAPALPDTLCCLLLYMDERDAYAAASAMLRESARSRHWYFPASAQQMSEFYLTFDAIVADKFWRLARKMRSLRVTSADYARDWFERLFVGALPYGSTVLRVFDAFIAEGSKILLRVGIALLQGAQATLLRASARDDFLAMLASYASQQYDADALMKRAFATYLARSSVSRKHDRNRTQAQTIAARVLEEHRHAVYYRPTLSERSLLLDADQFELLYSELPAGLRIQDLLLIYRSRDDGYNMRTLCRRSHQHAANLLLVRTTERRVVGCFAADAWRASADRFYGSTQCFIFAFDKRSVHVYHHSSGNHENDELSSSPSSSSPSLVPSASTEDLIADFYCIDGTATMAASSSKNDGDDADAAASCAAPPSSARFFQLVDKHGLTMGGGDGRTGLWLDAELSKGRTQRCPTFDNEPLVSTNGGEFAIGSIELWALK
jgi:Rab-GTPase-TBC domain/TLD